VNPTAIRFLLSINQNPGPFADRVFKDEKAVENFFQAMPTSYCNVQLTLFRDIYAKKVQSNDMYDISSLSIAIPYSDVVVCEKAWHSAVKKMKLDSLYGTTVLRSIKELGSIVAQI